MRQEKTINTKSTPELDVLIIGAGLSGVGAACRLRMHCPDERFEIFETRARMGGTWDLFRYPGIRSDSDMYTLGYPFRPWPESKPIADGEKILDYIEETAEEYDLLPLIRFDRKVIAADWSKADQFWTITYLENGNEHQITSRFLFGCAGYYDYDEGYTPQFSGQEVFGGDILHPQKWPEDFSAEGKKVVVIGSGATAITIVPALAEKAEHVTMLQRSPSDVVVRESEDGFAKQIKKIFKGKLGGSLIRWKSILMTIFQYSIARWKPDMARNAIKKEAQTQLGPDFDVEQNFTPAYNVWDQRVCLDPGSLFFDSLKNDKASIVTARIDRLDEYGIYLENGHHLEADIIVTATGLKIKVFGGVDLTVDGTPVNTAEQLVYKGMMVEDIPNFAFCFGYTNASWTLKADLSSRHVCRILNTMRKKNYSVCRPDNQPSPRETVPLVNFSSSYIQRAGDILPKQGTKAPWLVHQNYLADLIAYQFGQVEDGVLTFSSGTAKETAITPKQTASA